VKPSHVYAMMGTVAAVGNLAYVAAAKTRTMSSSATRMQLREELTTTDGEQGCRRTATCLMPGRGMADGR